MTGLDLKATGREGGRKELGIGSTPERPKRDEGEDMKSSAASEVIEDKELLWSHCSNGRDALVFK
jgi:hypothetical protein